MKSIFILFCAAIFFFAFTAMSLAGDGAGTFILDAPGPGLTLESSGFKIVDPWTHALSAAGVAGLIGYQGAVFFARAEMNFIDRTTLDGKPVNPVLEPASMFLVGTGLIALAGIGRRKFINKKGRSAIRRRAPAHSS